MSIKNIGTKVYAPADGKVKFKEKFLIKFERITFNDMTSFVIPTLLPKGFEKKYKFLKKIQKLIKIKIIGIINKNLKFSLLNFNTSIKSHIQNGNKKI